MPGSCTLSHENQGKGNRNDCWPIMQCNARIRIILQRVSCWLNVVVVVKTSNAGPVKIIRICLSRTLPATSSITKQLYSIYSSEAAKLTAFGNSAALEQLALSFEVQLYGWRAWGEHAETHAVLVAKLNNDASSLASVHGLRNV